MDDGLAATTTERKLTAGHLRVTLCSDETQASWTDSIEVRTPTGWQTALRTRGEEFSTSFGTSNGSRVEIEGIEGEWWRVTMSAASDAWTAEERITVGAAERHMRREQVFRFREDHVGAVRPGWALAGSDGVQLTFPLRAVALRPADLEPMTADVAWALPVPGHLLVDRDWMGFYGVDRTRSEGTIWTDLDHSGSALIGVQLPDTTEQPQSVDPTSTSGPDEKLLTVCEPSFSLFAAGQEVRLTELIALEPRGEGDPLLAAIEAGARVLLRDPPVVPDVARVCDGIADFYEHCELWCPDALGPGRGWFYNMWVRVDGDKPSFVSDGAGCFDLGWGEGIACELINGIAAHWRRTRSPLLLPYVDEISRNIALFRRGSQTPALYYDRYDGVRYSDFSGHDLIWTHSVAYTALQLVQAYVDFPDYPNADARRIWLDTAASIAGYLVEHQSPEGDLPDIFARHGRPLRLATSRIAARAVASGLFVRLEAVTGDARYLAAASKLAAALAPEIEAGDYANQMLDVYGSPIKVTDGESAYYVLQGLVPLLRATGDATVSASCERAAAVGVCWTYLYNVPKAYGGVARGGQTCRMPDFPLIFPGGTAKGVRPLLELAELTGKAIYRQMAREMVAMISSYQLDRPGSPWHGGIVHAIDQHSGRLWGPDREGQVDTGMSTGNSLAALEYWLASRSSD